jgi:DeoR family fructose operon transcriptional repressor
VPRDLFSYNEKVSQNQGRKEYICQLATQFIQDGDVIFIDSGSTLFYLCQHLKNFKNLIVITNSLPVVSELIQHDHIKINLIGGEIDNERKAVYGWLAENMLAQYHASKAFIGADGVSLQNGLTTYDEKEAGISRKLAFSADKVFLLCDSSKIEKNSYIKFAPLSVIDALITDADLVADVKADYEKQNVKIIN